MIAQENSNQAKHYKKPKFKVFPGMFILDSESKKEGKEFYVKYTPHFEKTYSVIFDNFPKIKEYVMDGDTNVMDIRYEIIDHGAEYIRDIKFHIITKMEIGDVKVGRMSEIEGLLVGYRRAILDLIQDAIKLNYGHDLA